jgi:hypothetical protein
VRVSPTTRRWWNAGRAASLCALLGLWSACARHTTTSVAWEGREFVEVGTLAALPAAIQDSLGAQRTGAEGIADRGARFNTTDVIEPGLPMRRFVVGGVAPDAAIVAYERGGRGYSVRVLLYDWSGPGVRRVRAWTTYDPPDGLAALIRSVQVSRSDRPQKPKRRPLPTRPRVVRRAVTTGGSQVVSSPHKGRVAGPKVAGPKVAGPKLAGPTLAAPARDSLATSRAH